MAEDRRPWEVTNSNSVECHDIGLSQSGSRILIPVVCLNCWNLDPGEFESIYRISGPFCEKNVWFPTKTGTCKKQNPIRKQAPDAS